MAVVEFRLLGEVEVLVDGRAADIGPARQRCVLASLLVDANRPVPVDRLVERAWAGSPPGRARVTLAGYVSRLRKALAAVTDVGLARPPAGYVLTVDPMYVDVFRFRDLVDRARAADEDDALARLDEALGLWRGEAFTGLDTPWLNEVRTAWAAARLAAELDRNDLALACGRHTELLPILSERTSDHPLDERLAAQHMVALYRCGRPADSLLHFERIRRALADELGADPSPPLRDLHRRVLSNDPALAAVAGPTVDASVAARPAGAAMPAPRQLPAPVPRQLPAPVPRLAGRVRELAALDDLLGAATVAPTTVVLATVSGTAGVGKTALAAYWAHRVAGRFSDGQLYLNLRGYDPSGPALAPAEAIRSLLDSLGVPAGQVPLRFDAQVGLYRSLLAGRRVLIVLDNARDAGQVRPLLPGSPGCLVVVTSRDQLGGLAATDGARPLHVDLLSPDESRDLLAHRLGAGRVASDVGAVDEIIRRCARLPLALSIVAARAACHETFPLSAVVAELTASEQSVAPFAGDDPASDLRAVFSWSYRTLSPPAARLFRLLSVNPGHDISAATLASLAGVTPERTRPQVAELVRAHLLIEHRPGRYTMHDLLCGYADETGRALDSDRRRQAARRRVLDHFLHSARAAGHRQHPHRDPLTVDAPRPGTTPEEFADHDAALAWFAAEHVGLLRAVDVAAANGLDGHAWRLAWCMWTYLDRQGHWSDMEAVGTTALAAARRSVDPIAPALMHRMLAAAFLARQEYAEARNHLDRAMVLYDRAGDLAGQAHLQHNLGYLHERRGEPAVALDHTRRSLALYRAAGHRQGESQALGALGWYHALLGDHARALPVLREALELRTRLGDRVGQAMTRHSLGYVHRHLGDRSEAVAHYRSALAVFRECAYRYLEADTLVELGDLHHAAGDGVRAVADWRRGLAILDELNHPGAAAVRARLEAGFPPDPAPAGRSPAGAGDASAQPRTA
jgi:DNA-binding SARP family transcriptional activator/tetratricopeptide (TPR) repeat protein